MEAGSEKEKFQTSENAEVSARAFVEHSFHIVRNLLRHRKVRYRELAKNIHQLHPLFGLVNLVIGVRQTTA